MVRIDAETFRQLVAYYDREGYDYLPDEGRFVPREDGPAAGRLPLSVQAALEGWDPDRFLDRSDELRSPPIRKPPDLP